jgi:hypothetical protein
MGSDVEPGASQAHTKVGGAPPGSHSFVATARRGRRLRGLKKTKGGNGLTAAARWSCERGAGARDAAACLHWPPIFMYQQSGVVGHARTRFGNGHSRQQGGPKSRQGAESPQALWRAPRAQLRKGKSCLGRRGVCVPRGARGHYCTAATRWTRQGAARLAPSAAGHYMSNTQRAAEYLGRRQGVRGGSSSREDHPYPPKRNGHTALWAQLLVLALCSSIPAGHRYSPAACCKPCGGLRAYISA